MRQMRYFSPLGEILLAAEDGALIGLWFRGQKYESAGLAGKQLDADLRNKVLLEHTCAWLDAYFDGRRPTAILPLAPRGTAFQQRVWHALQQIPYGETRSYGQLAEALGCGSARAVGAAVGRNPISILIPCHRCLGADGGLTGYAGGLERKAALLALEQGGR